MKKIAIHQSNYIPWRGYFDLIASVDEFIIYDDMQFTKNDWRNRNKIKTPKGLEWISIPVGIDIKQRIREVRLLRNGWNIKHWKMLELNYSRSPFFYEIKTWLEPIYLSEKHAYLSSFNRELIEAICSYLKIKTRISNSWDYNLLEGKTARLVDLCNQSGAGEYLSSPSAKAYLEESLFLKSNIKVTWLDYENYRPYKQLWDSEFNAHVSILDLLFNCGESSGDYMQRAPKLTMDRL
jgi:hypothetical protein